MTFESGELPGMKPFQSRVVAAWIVALPIAYAQHVSFVAFFVLMFGLLVILTLVIDELGGLVQLLFPERAETPKPIA